MRAGEKILQRAFGHVVTPLGTTADTAQRVHHTYEVRWLNTGDHSRLIEPSKDSSIE
jgi:hypothetical protein